jgi:hypothetical protein
VEREERLRQLLTERYRERLAGVLSCYDRIIVTGTLPGACYTKGMMGFLSARQIRVFDYPRFAEPLRDRVRDRACQEAHSQGRRRRQDPRRARRPSRPGPYHLGDGRARGRSAWQPDIDGKLTAFAAERIEQLFTAPETLGNWPQAKKHTQWPGSGRIGDPVFDAFYVTQVQYLADVVPTERVPPDARLFRLGVAATRATTAER